jgi:hypothetical protein
LISGSPKVAVAAAMRMSQTDASTQPAPSAGPLTAAITGTAQCRTALKVRRTILARSGSCSGVAARNSLRSRPAQNARVPAPVKIAQCTSVRAPIASKVSAISP